MKYHRGARGCKTSHPFFFSCYQKQLVISVLLIQNESAFFFFYIQSKRSEINRTMYAYVFVLQDTLKRNSVFQLRFSSPLSDSVDFSYSRVITLIQRFVNARGPFNKGSSPEAIW